MGFQPGALRQLQGVASVKAAAGREVDIFDAGIHEAWLGCGQAIGQRSACMAASRSSIRPSHLPKHAPRREFIHPSDRQVGDCTLLVVLGATFSSRRAPDDHEYVE
jgi:hypothetical protein